MNRFRLRYISNKAHFWETSSDIHAFMFLFFLVTIIRQLKLETGFKNLEIVLFFSVSSACYIFNKAHFSETSSGNAQKEQKIYN